MPRKKAATVYAASASQACERHHTAQKSPSQLPVPAAEPHNDPGLDHDLDAQSEAEDSSEDSIEELAGLDLTKCLVCELVPQSKAFEILTAAQTQKDWKKAERSLPRGKQTVHAPQTLNEHKQHECEKFNANLKLQDSSEVEKFWNHFGIQLAAQQVASSNYNFAHRKPRISSTSATITLPNPVTSFAAHHLPSSSETVLTVKQTLIGHYAPPSDNSAPSSSDLKELVFDGYLSDLHFSDSESKNEDANYTPIQLPNSSYMLLHPGLKRPASALPSNPSTPLKKWRLNPDQLLSALKDITHHLKSAKTQLHADPEGLEAR
ncbi:hypothetical protein GYMLUDRAFT_63278 [Collybiopsis luxurians FD-317 M1]|uniref:Uncharacterized protein n=1 Tax=Collybiopsis luxurians FD-317 M1 TaxID=944289 RepID=A0A0D0CHD3_9AGAR|nr:hypothetical protein GYMLUDRAFT_63278 [Collybiopsis luxurians FD-317 M1]